MKTLHRTALVLGLLLALDVSSVWALPKLGAAAADASMEDADGRRAKVSSFSGKPILIVYEDKDSATLNQPFKDDLAKLAAGDKYRESIALLPLADVSAYNFWPVKGFVKDAIREESKKVGTTIYCDWDASFRSAFDIRAGSSSIILVGRNGAVLFAAEGALSVEQREKVVSLLRAEVEGP